MCQVIWSVFETILSSDDSLQFWLVTKCSRVQCCFCLGLWSKRGNLKNKGGISHVACVKRCCILEQPKRICSYLLPFSLISFSMKRSNKSGPPQDPVRSLIISTEMFTVHGCFPSYRLLETRSRSGYAVTVSGPAPSLVWSSLWKECWFIIATNRNKWTNHNFVSHDGILFW